MLYVDISDHVDLKEEDGLDKLNLPFNLYV